MSLEPKEIKCECGNSLIIERESDWCLKCGKKVFYNAKARRADKLNSYYMYSLIILVGFFITYAFIELVVGPIMNNFR